MWGKSFWHKQLTLIIEHVVYVTSRFDFYFRHFQRLLFDLIAYFFTLIVTKT
jgi:hypothetical protein